MNCSTLAVLAALATNEYEAAGWLAFILLVADQFVRRTAWGACFASSCRRSTSG